MSALLRAKCLVAPLVRSTRPLAAMSTSTWQSTVPTWNFSVSPANGWMPRFTPLKQLPTRFKDVEALLQDMPINRSDGSKGLLSRGEFGEAALSRLSLHDVKDITDPLLVTALFRDYSFLASAYLLEPSHLGMSKDGKYGLGRDHLPKTIAVPLTVLASKLDSHPFLDYAHGYALNNWEQKDPSKGMDYQNLKLIRTFEGGKDEEGFIVIHIAMVNESKAQIAAQIKAMTAVQNRQPEKLAEALNDHAAFLKKIVGIFGEMWKASSPRGYLGFRTFIMGITGNDDIFPHGVIFQGVDPAPRYYRGETGAQDSIVPSTDTLLGMPYPVNKLTDYLMDLRSYRPKDHREYLVWLKKSTAECQIKDVLLSNTSTAVALLRNLEMTRTMRAAHWVMTQMYIIRNTKHPKATGGTPITTWLPNQLGSTMEYMREAADSVDKLVKAGHAISPRDEADYNAITSDLDIKINALKSEVASLQGDFQNQEVDEFQQRLTRR